MNTDSKYPKCDHHEVRCPQCRRSLANVKPHAHPLADAKWAKHCGAPCYGTAWYTLAVAEPESGGGWGVLGAGFKVNYTKPTRDDPLKPTVYMGPGRVLGTWEEWAARNPALAAEMERLLATRPTK